MEALIIIPSVLVGVFVMGTSGLVYLAKYLKNKIDIENEEKMDRICNKIADKIEADFKKSEQNEIII